MPRSNIPRDRTKKHKPLDVIQSSIYGNNEGFFEYVSDLEFKKAKRKLLIVEVMRRRNNER